MFNTAYPKKKLTYPEDYFDSDEDYDNDYDYDDEDEGILHDDEC